MDESGNPRLFVSHHSSKLELAFHVEKALALHGVVCWIAPRDVEPGESFDTAIRHAIADCDAVLLLFCSQSDKSRHVKRELILADSARKAIIPLRLEEVSPDELAYHLASSQWVDWLEQRDGALKRIAEQARRLAGTPSRSSEDPEVVEGVIASLAAARAQAPVVPLRQQQEATLESGQDADAGPRRRSLMPVALAGVVAVAILGGIALGNRSGSEREEQGLSIADSANLPHASPAPDDIAPAPDVVEPVPAAPAFSPSFPCEKASTPVEEIICSDERLSLQDRELTSTFAAMKALLETQEPNLYPLLRANQRSWRVNERDNCRDAECVREVVAARIDRLRKWNGRLREELAAGVPVMAALRRAAGI